MVDRHYRAFISYSHRDRDAGERLHRKLEAYRVPSKLVGALTGEGSVPRRLTPIFRDREDLPTSGDLSASVQTALTRTRFLIVLCSPAAAASEWVDKEIARFKAMHGETRILGVIIDNPETAGVGDPAQLFPPALRFRVGEDGKLTDVPAEPLAADLRESGDGDKLGFLKIVAGLIGVGLDDLVQRDQSRRNRTMQFATGGLALTTLVLAGLTWFAFDARRQADLQRREAEGLVEFMLTDLRDTLDSVGRLDALSATGEKLLDYYAAQDPDWLDADSLARRARAQLLVGEIDQARNDLDAALSTYEAAAATTEELLSREPNNPERIFDHAQSVFYVGYIAHQRNDIETAEKYMQDYLQLAQRLVAIDAANTKWRMELAYATSNLGALKYAESDYDEAAPLFEQSSTARRVMYETAPGDDDIAKDFAYALSWLGLAERQRGNYSRTISIYEEQLAVYEAILDRQPDDFSILDFEVTARRRLSESHLALGDVLRANAAAADAEAIVNKLLAREPENAYWKLEASYIGVLQSQLAALNGDNADAAAKADAAVAMAREVVDIDESTTQARKAHGLALAQRLSIAYDDEARAEAAAALSPLFHRQINTGAKADFDIIGEGADALSAYWRDFGDVAKADQIAHSARLLLGDNFPRLSASVRFSLYRICTGTSGETACEAATKSLEETEFRHPDYVADTRRASR